MSNNINNQDFVFTSDRESHPAQTCNQTCTAEQEAEQKSKIDYNQKAKEEEVNKIAEQARAEIQEYENKSDEEKKGDIMPLYKKEEIIQLHNKGYALSTIGRKLRIKKRKVKRILDVYKQEKENDPDGLEARRQAIQDAFVGRAWEIIEEADKLTLEKLRAGRASAAQANTIAAIRIDKIMNLWGKSTDKKKIEHEHEHMLKMDNQMFRDFAKVVSGVAKKNDYVTARSLKN